MKQMDLRVKKNYQKLRRRIVKRRKKPLLLSSKRSQLNKIAKFLSNRL